MGLLYSRLVPFARRDASVWPAAAVVAAMRNPGFALLIATRNAAPPDVTASVFGYALGLAGVIFAFLAWRRWGGRTEVRELAGKYAAESRSPQNPPDGSRLDNLGIRSVRWALQWKWRNLPMRIIVGNLPDDVSEEGIRTALSPFAPVEKVKLVKESGTPSALIEMEMTRAQAEALAKRIQGRVYQGRELRAWVPVMDW